MKCVDALKEYKQYMIVEKGYSRYTVENYERDILHFIDFIYKLYYTVTKSKAMTRRVVFLRNLSELEDGVSLVVNKNMKNTFELSTESKSK